MDEGDRGAGTAAELDLAMVPREIHEFDAVAHEDVADMDRLDFRHGCGQVPHVQSMRTVDRVERGHGDGALALPLEAQGEAAAHDLGLVRRRGIGQAMPKQEAIELRFGQLEGARLLDGVLRGDHEKGRGQVVRGVADRDAAFLHRLEQRRLHLGRGAVDLVGEEQVREDRALVDAKLAGPLLEDLAADDVARQQVDRELHAGEGEVDRLRDRLHKQRLRDAGHAFKKEMTAGEERDEHPLDDGLLTDDGAGDLAADVLDEGRAALRGGGAGGRGGGRRRRGIGHGGSVRGAFSWRVRRARSRALERSTPT